MSCPKILQVNHYFITIDISVSPVSRFPEATDSLPFPELDKVLPSQGLYALSFFTWASCHSLTLSFSLLRCTVGDVFPAFFILYRNSYYLLPFIFLHATYIIRCVYCFCCLPSSLPTVWAPCRHVCLLCLLFCGLSLKCLAPSGPSINTSVSVWIVSFPTNIILGTE